MDSAVPFLSLRDFKWPSFYQRALFLFSVIFIFFVCVLFVFYIICVTVSNGKGISLFFLSPLDKVYVSMSPGFHGT